MSGHALVALWLAGGCLAATRSGDDLSQDVEIRAAATGPALSLPQPRPDRAVVDEVVDSLKVMSQEHSARAATVPGSSQRLSRPYPEAPYLSFSPRAVTAPYDLWTFEVVVGGNEVLWRQDGTGKVREPLEWDGSGPAGDEAVRVGPTYFFRFTGRRGPESFLLTSEPVVFKSLALREFLGGARLEVANDELFAPGSAALKPGAADYLRPLSDRLRRLEIKDAYELELYQANPDSALAGSRAAALRRWLADALLVNAGRVEVKRLTLGERGDVTACRLAAEKGDTIRSD